MLSSYSWKTKYNSARICGTYFLGKKINNYVNFLSHTMQMMCRFSISLLSLDYSGSTVYFECCVCASCLVSMNILSRRRPFSNGDCNFLVIFSGNACTGVLKRSCQAMWVLWACNTDNDRSRGYFLCLGEAFLACSNFFRSFDFFFNTNENEDAYKSLKSSHS